MKSVALALFGIMTACSASVSPDQQALLDVKKFIQANIDDLATAVAALQSAAPAPDADGWNATADAAALANMKTEWKKARTAYEHIEGAIAVLFPDLDVSTDARYDALISTDADTNLFDDQGATGIHSIERILWSDSIPARVITFESGLPNYVAARFPSNLAEATDFKNKLCARLVTDVSTMKTQFGPLALDSSAAYRGVIGSINEQVEKANLAATGQEESRYAQYTLADMRVNVGAGQVTYQAFQPWLKSKGGNALDAQIAAGFMRLQNAYAALSGDALPPVPSTWSAMPSAADLATPFGVLYTAVAAEADPASAGSLVSAMNQSADLLAIPQLPE